MEISWTKSQQWQQEAKESFLKYVTASKFSTTELNFNLSFIV